MRETNPIRSRSLLAAIALTVATAACGTVADSVSSTSQSDQTTVTAGATATTADPTLTKVNANSASVEEIAAAIAAAGVENADRWAREVAEYRPYDTSDLELSHLRDELAKYNPGAGVVDLIVSALEP